MCLTTTDIYFLEHFPKAVPLLGTAFALGAVESTSMSLNITCIYFKGLISGQ